MSDWLMKELERLRKVVREKRTKDEKFVLQEQIKEQQGRSLWQATREHAGDLAKKLNDGLGEPIFSWQAESDNQIAISAGPFKTSVTANYNPGSYAITYRTQPATSNGEIKMGANDDGQAVWIVEAKQKSALGAAEFLVGLLSKNIRA